MNPRPVKSTLFFAFWAFVVLVILMLIVVAPTMVGPHAFPFTPLSVIVAAGAGVYCIYWSLVKLLPPGPPPIPGVFQTNMLICLAAADMVELAGIFLGTAPIGPYPFGAVSLALMLGMILPKVVRYCKSLEAT